jgi:predicted Kef-type K+ transport protein
MELSSILIALVFTLGATAICVILFQNLGFGSVLGFIVGRYLLPAVLGYTARQRHMDAFGIVLFLAVIAAAWAVDQVGISMTLGAFLMGMLLSASDYVTTAEPDRAEGLAVSRPPRSISLALNNHPPNIPIKRY